MYISYSTFSKRINQGIILKEINKIVIARFNTVNEGVYNYNFLI